MNYIKHTYDKVYDYIFSKKCIVVGANTLQIEYKNLHPKMPLGDLIEKIISSEEMIGYVRNDMILYSGTTALHHYNMYDSLETIFNSSVLYLNVSYLHTNEFMTEFEQYRHFHTSCV